jgi:hypothetical protein
MLSKVFEDDRRDAAWQTQPSPTWRFAREIRDGYVVPCGPSRSSRSLDGLQRSTDTPAAWPSASPRVVRYRDDKAPRTDIDTVRSFL